MAKAVKLIFEYYSFLTIFFDGAPRKKVTFRVFPNKLDHFWWQKWVSHPFLPMEWLLLVSFWCFKGQIYVFFMNLGVRSYPSYPNHICKNPSHNSCHDKKTVRYLALIIYRTSSYIHINMMQALNPSFENLGCRVCE